MSPRESAPNQPTRQVTSPELERKIEQAGLSPEDAWQIREFVTFLSMVKRPPGTTLSPAKRAQILERFGPEWLGIEP